MGILEINLRYLRNGIIVCIYVLTFMTTAVVWLKSTDLLKDRAFYFLIIDGAGLIACFIGWFLAKIIYSYLLNDNEEPIVDLEKQKTSTSVARKQREFELNIYDILAYHSYNFEQSIKASRLYKVQNLVASIFGIIIFICATPLVILYGKEDAVYSILLYVLAIIPVCFLFISIPFRFPTSIKNSIIKQYSNPNRLVGKHHLSFTDDAIIDHTDQGEFTLNWSTIKNIETTYTHIFLVINPAEFYIIPRRAFFDAIEFTKYGKQIKALTQTVKNT